MNTKRNNLENPLNGLDTINKQVSEKKNKTARNRLKINTTAISKLLIPEEIEEQKTLVDYCNTIGYLSFAVPNAGKRGKTAQRNAKKEGILEGVSDYVVFLPKYILFIEMKRKLRPLKSGKYSASHTPTRETQIDFIKRANKYPYAKAKICYGAEEAINFIKEYNNKI